MRAPIDEEMMSFTTPPTPHTCDENPGGMIRQDGGFGSNGFVILPTGDVRKETNISRETACAMGEAGRNIGEKTNIEVGGPCSLRQSFSSVIAKGIPWGTTHARAGGPVSLSSHSLFVAFNEVVFCSNPVPGGSAC